MKKIATFLFACFLSASMFAQVPDGTVIPDWTSMTLDNTEWNLYEHLNEGRPVLIDVSATWCGPCWSYHNGGAFKDTWNAHGPDGDNTIGMLMVEGDADTNIDCLYGPTGCNDATAGDWVTGTPYPITDDTYVAQTIFDISAYPSIFVVCPDRTVKKLGQDNAATLYAATQNCSQPDGTNNAYTVAFESGASDLEICGGSEMLTPKLNVINWGTSEMTSATIELSYGGTVVETIDWTGSLNTYNSTDVEFTPFSVSEPGMLTAEVTSVNGTMDDDMSDNSKSISFTAAPEYDDQKLIVDIMTDQYGGELYWEARMADGTVFASGGNATVGPNGGASYGQPPADTGAYANSSAYTEEVVIPEGGCYYFHIVDAYGDGMCCAYGNGHFRVYNGSDVGLTNPLIDAGTFDAYERKEFGTSQTFTNVDNLIPATSLAVFPNPTSTNLNVRFNLNEATEVGVVITNTLGQVVQTIAPNNMVTGQQALIMPVQNLANGLYNVVLQTPEGSIARKFTVLK